MTSEFIPCTPAGTLLMELAANTEDEAWQKLLKAAAYVWRYRNRDDLIKRGYTVQPSNDKASEPDWLVD